MPRFDKIVVVTQKTALEELIERFNTKAQARFYVNRMRVQAVPAQGKVAAAEKPLTHLAEEAAHEQYKSVLKGLAESLPAGLPHQFLDREFLPNFLFGEGDLVIALGRDGLVVNTAKYLNGQPLVGVNPDPRRIDGVLVRFPLGPLSEQLPRLLEGRFAAESICMAKATLTDGQVLYGVNDLFIGQRTHLSARYQLRFGKELEEQSSSGIIVSTGAGSTGWFRSVLTGAIGVAAAFGGGKELDKLTDKYRFPWDAEQLYFSVREPFISKTSGAKLVFGKVTPDKELLVTSQMPQGGVIFSDGIESDHLAFGSGTTARIGLAEKKVNLVVPER